MKHRTFARLAAPALGLSLLLSTPAQALNVEQARELLNTYYVDDIPDSVLARDTINGMIEALGDPYTQYFTQEEYAAFTASMSDTSLVGIGIVSAIQEDGLLVKQVLEGSAAEKAGLQEGDLILAVDGQAVPGEDSDTVLGWIRGEEGTKVSITYHRNGVSKTVTMTRALVVVPSTTSQLVDGHIGYISCTTFGEETAGHFREALERYGAQATVWIVDLRSNTGGRTDAAVQSAGLFTGSGPMVILRDGEDNYSAYYHTEDAETLYPVIVLVDGYSASSSEIFAAAIRDHGAGIVVGTRTFGKGVAQSVIDQTADPELFPDGDAIKITSHRFYTPAGNTTDQIGVIPDLLLSPELTQAVALLLSSENPGPSTEGYLRVDLGWQWFVDLSKAKDPDYQAAFQALLDAIPDNKSVWLGTGGINWERSSVEEIAARTGLTYHAPLFPDQEESDYYTQLSVLYSYDLVHGGDDGLYHPQDTLTRAELCQLLAEALNCNVPTGSSPFSDVAEDAWYKPAVLALSNMGLVNGTGNGTFRPEDTIDHQQLITILARLARRLNMSLYNTAQAMPEGATNIVGLLDYADWAKDSAWLLSYSQTGYFGNTISLLWDSADAIEPTAATTRDEAACALYRLLSLTGILPA